MNATRKKVDWSEQAAAYARDAHEDHFASRKGVWHLAGRDVLCFYDNDPRDGCPT